LVSRNLGARAHLQFSSRTATAGEPAARAWFVSELRHVFEIGPKIDDTFHIKVALFLDEIELFIALLENVRELPDTPDWADERACATYQMLDFIKRIDRQELYIRFIHQLKDIFVKEKKWMSAGLTLKLHADLHDWSKEGDMLDALEDVELALPAQTSFARKEAIYRHCLEFFGEFFEVPLAVR
jgi:dedicator of cytokinesis protein 3